MKHPHGLGIITICSIFILSAACGPMPPEPEPESVATMNQSDDGTPTYKVDPFWPKELPNNWILGQVSGMAVDSQDHIWIIQRPSSLDRDERALSLDPPEADCCIPAPPVIEFDSDGNVIQAWGGQGEGYEWPTSEHGIFVDHMDNVWTAGAGKGDNQVLKWSRDGTFLLQIGHSGPSEGSNNTSQLGQPADMEVDPETNEIYVADGYLNKRLIVFDADTGEYKRHWGAYGNKPDDANPGPYDPDAPIPQQFRSPVHCVRIANDGLVYVCDRTNNRIQVFQKDGTFIEEVFVAKRTLGVNGSTFDVELSPDAEQLHLFTADGANEKVWMLLRQDLSILGSFGRSGRQAGQFHWLHNVVVDSQGNIYTSEVESGKRIQKFVPSPGA